MQHSLVLPKHLCPTKKSPLIPQPVQVSGNTSSNTVKGKLAGLRVGGIDGVAAALLL